MPYQVKLKAAEKWTLSRIAWTNTVQKIPQMSELTVSNHRFRAQFKCVQTVVGQRLLEMDPTVCPSTTTTTTHTIHPLAHSNVTKYLLTFFYSTYKHYGKLEL